MIDKQIISEIKELMKESHTYTINDFGKLGYDGNQFSIKIPKHIADKIRATPNMEVQFEITTYSINENKKPKLVIQL